MFDISVCVRAAKLDTDGLRAGGVSSQDMALHLALIFEYGFTRIEPGPLVPGGHDALITLTVMDCKNISLTKAVSFDSVALLRATSEVLLHLASEPPAVAP